MDSSNANANESSSPLLPQYGFGATYKFDELVEHHHFLYRVHTPKTKRGGAHSRATSPSPRSSSPFTPSRRATLTRSPSSLSASVTSIRSTDSGPSDYFGNASTLVGDEEDDTAPGDPYFLSRKFKDDLSSPDPGQRRRTISRLSTLSGDSGAYSFIGGSDDGSDAESEHASFLRRRGTLSRSTSMMLGHSRVRSDSLSSSSGGRPGAKRSQSVEVAGEPSPSPSPSTLEPRTAEASASDEGTAMTYSDLVRHLDWTTRSSSPYVRTSFSFFWCLWEAVRRYKLGVKHDVEIAVIDARKVRGRARTALEVLRSVEQDKQDKAYWKWYRFALESQDVLVFGAISGDAIYASIPLTQILPKLPSYFFVVDESVPIPKAISDPREPDPSSSSSSAFDPRSPTSSQTQNPIFPSTPNTPSNRARARSPLAGERGEREREREALSTAHLLTRLAWDIGTTLKPIRKPKGVGVGVGVPKTQTQTPGKPAPAPAPRHTSHSDFCKALSAAFARRSEADQMRDATTGVVGLAELLIEPWFRARCAEYVSYPFRHHDDDGGSDDEKVDEGDKTADSVCLGLAGDGCALEHSHDSSIQDALFDKDEETEEEAARREAASVLSELALSLARWPAALWYTEHVETVETLVTDVVNMCVTEAARGIEGRIAWGIAFEGERQRTRTRTLSSVTGSVRSSRVDTLSLSGSLSGSVRSERRGREQTREREREGSRSRSPTLSQSGTPSSTKHVRIANASEDDGSPSPSPSPSPKKSSSLRESPYKPRARSPLGSSPILGPAIVIRPKSKPEGEAVEMKPPQEQERSTEQAWSPSTPPPSPPRSLAFSFSEGGDLKSVSPSGRRSPPPPPPPRSNRRLSSPSSSSSSPLDASLLPSPNASPSPSSSLTSSSPSSLLKRSIHRRAESIPGSWPNSSGDNTPTDRPGSPAPSADAKQPSDDKKEKEQEADVFWDPALREQEKKRPLSWSGSGIVLGAAGASLSANSSVESLRVPQQSQSSPSSSPSSSIRRSTPSRSQSDSQVQVRETLLTEVVSSALGLAASAVAASVTTGTGSEPPPKAASPSPLQRLDTPASEPTSGSERQHHAPPAPPRHRRHSSHGASHFSEVELSPVREAEHEEEADADLDTDVDAEEKGQGLEKSPETPPSESEAVVDVVDVVDVVVRDDDEETKEGEGDVEGVGEPGEDEVVQPEEVLLPSTTGEETPRTSTSTSVDDSRVAVPEVSAAEVEVESTTPPTTPPRSGSSTPRSERRRSRSGTLASIPEEDWTDWAMVEVPPATEYQVEAEQPEIKLEESEIPLPPSPRPESIHLEDEGKEERIPPDAEVVRAVPEITLTPDSTNAERENRAAVEDSPKSATSDETTAGEVSRTLVDSRVFILPLNLSLRDQLTKTRALLSTFLALPIYNTLRRISPAGSLPLLSPTPMPSPIFEDVEVPSTTYRRLSRFFSFFRIPLLHSESESSFFSRRRQDGASQQKQQPKSMSSILAPPPWWDAPIPECEPEPSPPPDTSDNGYYWDPESTSWAIASFVAGVTAAIALAVVQQHRYEAYILAGNRYH